MDPRLDPGCLEARTLTKRHRDQDALLVAGSQGQLAAVVKTTQDKQVKDHLITCARCRHYDPRCPTCGFDVRRERHGWMCAAQGSRWRDLLPWNWRPKQAPRIPAGATFKHRQPPPATAARPPAPVRRVDVQQHQARSEYSPPPAERAASSAPKPRAKPQPPKPNALALAYASLGLAPEASEEAVRMAYRSRAQMYHPDKVAHLAPEFRAVAETKMAEINLAYERIKRSWPAPAPK